MPPPGFPDSGNNCGSPIICDNLDGYCTSINNNNQQRGFPCCNNSWVLNNDEWFGFFAGTTQISIQITPSNCSGGNPGLQGAIYAACPPGYNGSSKPQPGSQWCNDNMMDIQCNCTEDPFILESSNFVVGQVYWIVLDGCAGNLCDYSVEVLSGSTIPFPPEDPGPVTGLQQMCMGGPPSTYSVDPIEGATQYHWTLTPSNAGTISSNGTVTWAAGFTGTAEVCVTSSNQCFSNDNPSCLEVTVFPNPTATISGSGVFCAGGGGGSADLTITFTGVPEWRFTYALNGVPQPPPITTSDNPYILTVNQAGTYTLVNVVSNGCTGTVSGSVNLTTVTLNPSATTVAAICGESNGSVNFSVSGGNNPYMFIWSNGATTEDLSNVPPGSYSVTVTDANGCTAELTVNVNDNINNPNLSATVVANTSCNTGNGSINLTVTPAGSYGYTWSNGATTEDIGDLPVGSYTVTVTQGLTCSSVATFDVPDNPNNPNVTLTPVATTCELANGSVNANVTGGVAPYQFNWSNGDTNQNLTDISAGNYSITVTGANGCTNVANVNVSNSNPPINVTATVVPNTICDSNGGDGSINVTVTPAGSYTYNWSNGSTNEDLSNIGPGSYTITVSAGGACTAEATFNVPDNPNNPNVSLTPIATTCDLANGSVNSSVSGGVAPYQYNWSNGATTQNITDILAGGYTLTVTGANGCTAEATANVSNNNPPINITATVVANTICNGGNGSINVTVTPAGSYTYNWSNGSTNEDLTGLEAGPYTITVSAGGSCTGEATFNVPNNPNNPNVSFTSIASTCDLPNGSASSSVSGGTPGYTYNWSTGATTQNIADVLSGGYSLTVTDVNGCTAEGTVNVSNNNPPININATVVGNTICNGGNGSISVTVTPAGSYTYNWSNGSTDLNISNLVPGPYTITVSAGGSCTAEATFDVPNSPNLPNIMITPVASSCDLPNGSASASVSGGTPGYTYSWSNGATTQNIPDVLSGGYSLTITDASGCTAEASVNVPNVNPPININATIVANTTCNGGNGSISVTVTPAASYTYSWSNGSTDLNQSNLVPGAYTITVSAGGSCTAEATFNVPNEPNLPNPSATPTPSSCDLPNGSVTSSVSGGVPPYQYNWSNGATTQNINNVLPGGYSLTVTGANGCTAEVNVNVPNINPPINLSATTQPNTVCNAAPNGSVNLTVNPPGNYTFTWSNGATTEDLNGVAPGSYTVTVSAGGSCTEVATFDVPANPNEPTVSISFIQTSCDFPNGSVSISVTGGPTPYTYLWSNGATTQNLNNILAGDYSVTVTSPNGCTGAASVTVINANPVINITPTIVPQTACNANNGSISISVSPPANYTFGWSNGASTQNLNNIPAGNYTVTVSAGGSCTEVASFDVPFQPNAPVITPFISAANCGLPNGSVSLQISNSIPPYTYVWSSGQTNQNVSALFGGDYAVTVTGANGCSTVADIQVPDNIIPVAINGTWTDKTSCVSNNGTISISVTPPNANISWSIGGSSPNLINLAPGDYTVTVSAGGTCTETQTFSIVDVTEIPFLTADITHAICSFNNGAVDLTVEYGIPPYSINWGHLPGNSNPEDLVNLPAGNYVVTVTSSVGCSAILFAPVNNEPIQIDILALVFDDVSCTSNNGFIDLDVSPIVNYTYNWAHIPGNNNQQNINNLGAGTYTVTVTYGSCNAISSFDILNAAVTPTVSIAAIAATCGQSDGAVTLSVSGASPPYTYNWAHLPGSNNPQNLSNVPPGTYTVTVTDFFDCSATASATVVNNTIAVNINGVPTPNTSCAGPNGSIDVSVTPANNYSYTWSNGANTQDLANLTPGTYSVTASAGVGCSSTATFIVGNNTVDPQINANVVAAICSQSNGSIDITVSSGTAPYLYVWSNAANTEDLSNIFPGNYSLTVTDANGCTADTTLNVANNATTFSISGTASPHSDCATINGAIDLTVTPPGPYTYLWSTGDVTQDLSNLPAGAYTVQVTEQGTCVASATYFVIDTRTYPTLNQSVGAELCGLNDGNINLTVLGGLPPFTYTWDSGQMTEDLNNISSGTYNVTVAGANNCSATASIVVPDNDLSFSIAGTPSPNTSCVVLDGAIDLSITPAVPSGGPGYTYTWSNGPSTQSQVGIPAGTYIVTVSAGGTCTNTAAFVVADVAGAPSLSQSITEALCGQSSGNINLSVSSGTGPYTYNWSTGATTEDLTGVPSGNYAVTVTGANGCQVAGAYVVPEGVVTPTLSGVPQANTACIGPNGSINLSISPSSLVYTINWSNGATTANINNLTAGDYSVTVNGGGFCENTATYTVDDNTIFVTASGTQVNVLCFGNNTGAINLILTGGTQPFTYNWSPNLGNIEDPANLAAGTYSVTVTDVVGCTTATSFAITQPSASVQVTCTALNSVSEPGLSDGSAQVQVSGGTAPYSIAWSPGSTQNGVAAGIFPLNDLSVGNYGVTVTDANGCTRVCGFNIPLALCETAVGTMGGSQIALCGTGCITANYNALGQILDPNDVLQFILHEGPGTTIINEIARSSQPTFCFNAATMNYGTTYYVSAVAGNNDGMGNVVLAHFCTVISTGTPIVFYRKPEASAALPAPITCAAPQVPVFGSSTMASSTYSWSSPNGVIVGNANQATITVASAGTYILIVNANGCLDTTQTTVIDIRNDPEAKIYASPDDILDCVIDEIVLAGEIKGTGNSNAIWIDQNGFTYPGGTTLQITQPGTYWFAIVDTVTFCSDTASIVIGENQVYPPLFIDPPGSLNCAVGSVTLSGGSPFGGIDFQWVTVSGQDTTVLGTGQSIVVTQPNTYILIGIDPLNGCNNALDVVVITDQSFPTANAGPPFNIDCFGQTANLNGSATGGTGAYSYVWTTSGGNIVSGSNTANPTISEPGTYNLLVTSTGNGCTDTDVVVIAPNDPRALATVNNPVCFGYKGSVVIDTVLGAKPPLQYTLTGGSHVQAGNLFSNLSPGDYSIFIEDVNGCATSVDVTIVQPPVFEVSVEPQATVQLGESYLLNATVNVPLSDIASITWTPTTWLSCDTCLSTRIDTPLFNQMYRVLVVTKEGCRDDAPFMLRVNRQVNVYIPNIFSPNDDGDNDWFTIYADSRGVKQIRLFQIFSRWGEQVFERTNFQPNDPTLGWDGRFRGQDMNPAVFVYYAIVEFIDGQEVLYKGDVTIKR